MSIPCPALDWSYKYSIVWHHAIVGAMKKTCLFIPGNPAVARYYLSWIDELQQKIGGLDITYATSYVLFGRRLDYVAYDAAMRGHYESCLLDLNASGKITIIAHSVGSYFALKLLEKYPEKIEKVILLFPYLGYNQLTPLRFASIPYELDRFLPVVETASRFRSLFFQRWYEDTKNISYAELKACLRFGVRQCTYFNKHQLDVSAISQYKDKIDFFYTKNDGWCPPQAIELLKPISRYQEVDIPHDFVVKPENRDKMTEQLVGIL
jgi:pimeloyl-ACP methyl ester carboxylesterase